MEEGGAGMTREDRIRAVYTQMEALSRRAVARARKSAAPLSFVQHSLLTYIASTPGCRAIDIAGSFRLNRSTVSRQVADLMELDLVDYVSGAQASARGQIIDLTEHGRDLLDRSHAGNRASLEGRLTEFSDAEIDALATALERFNAAGEE
jgi:DNA-binding MarR family transcriptional regulator